MPDVLKHIWDFEQVAIAVCLAFCTVSQIARLARNEYRQWQSPKLKNPNKQKRKASR
jgi:hypothetical protein